MSQLPENFGSFEHLQKVYRQQFNQQVKEYFQDLGETWEPEVNTPRGSLRVACTMLDDDSAEMMSLRHSLFYDVLGYGKHGLVKYWGKVENESPVVTGHPKIIFYFSQDAAATPENQKPADAEYSLRLINETQATFTPAKAREIAREIKNEFLVGQQGITLVKGKIRISMNDPENGFTTRQGILCNQESDAIDIYQRMYRVIDAAFNLDLITNTTPKKQSTTQTGTHLVYGKTRKKRAYRPINTVRFRYSFAEIAGLINPVWLVDTTYRYPAFYYPNSATAER